MDYKTFIHEIELLRDYKRSMSDLLSELDLLEYEMENVRAIQYDKEPSKPNPQSEEYRLELIERKDDLNRKIDRTAMYINDLEPRVYLRIIHMKGDGVEILVSKYGMKFDNNHISFGQEKTYEQLCEIYHYSGTSSVWRKMRKAVEDI